MEYYEDNDYFVQLSPNPVCFDPASPTVNVFYDDANHHVFVVRSNGAGGIIVIDTTGNSKTLRIDDKGEIFTVRLSPSSKILTIQRAPNALDFLNYTEGGKASTTFCQTCKGKTTKINDFFWSSETEIIFVTDMGLEFYEVDAYRRNVKCTKTVSLGEVNWSLWHMGSKFLVVSSGLYGNVLFPFSYENSTLTKYNRLEVDLAYYPQEPKLALLRRDVILSKLYTSMYIILLKQDSRATHPAEIVLYKVSKDRLITRTNVLQLTSCGLFQLNIVDSLLIVHHLQSKMSFLYDIKFASVMDQQVAIHRQPLIAPLPLKQVEYRPKFVSSLPGGQAGVKMYEMYSSNWIVFQPDVIIDAAQGCLWKVELNLNAFPHMISDRCLLVDVLLHRAGAKQLVLSILKEMIMPATASTLSIIADVFNKINQIYAYNADSDFETLTLMTASPPVDATVTIQQDDVYTHIFCPVFCDSQVSYSNKLFPISVMIEYINSLQTHGLNIYFFLYELLVNSLVKSKEFFRLHQFLQYHLLCDSKQLACLLLSIKDIYPPAYQIAIDMFKRLGNATEEIVDVFLAKKQILTAIRYLKSVGAEKLPSRLLLKAAMESEDDNLFYTTYKYLQEENIRLRRRPSFSPSDECHEYVDHFNTRFPRDYLPLGP